MTSNVELARIEISAALHSIHKRFAHLVVDKFSKAVAKSSDLQRCDDLANIDGVVQSYRYFMDDLIEFGRNGNEQSAARTCALYARELMSISRLVTAYPESARSRAAKLLEAKYQNRMSL
jgi:hypothetical protein